MRLKFRKVSALLLAGAMTVTPMASSWAADPDPNEAYQWVEGDNGSTAIFNWDEDTHTASIDYTLQQVGTTVFDWFHDDETTVAEGYPKEATCEEQAIDRFTYLVTIGTWNKGLLSPEFRYGEALGHDYGEYELVEVIDPAVCEQDGIGLYRAYCSRCDAYLEKEAPIAALEHIYKLNGYTGFDNIDTEETFIPDADGVWEGEADPSHPKKDRPELSSGFFLEYECELCHHIKEEWHEDAPIAVLEGEPEINVMSINNLYYVVEYDYIDPVNPNVIIDDCDLAMYPLSGTMDNVQVIDDVITGRIMNGDGVRIAANTDGTYNDAYLVDCTKDGSYDIVRYAKNSDGSWMLDASGNRIIARTIETVTVDAPGHRMTAPVIEDWNKDVYRCDITLDENGNIIGAVPTTCQDGWYNTYSNCKNPNCDHTDDQHIVVSGDEKLHQFPANQWKLVLDTQNCYNYGVQVYERYCVLCGAVDTRVDDNSEMIKYDRNGKEGAHNYGTPELVEWLVVPTCTEPGKYLSHESCTNEWYNEDGTTYVCGHEQETEVVVKALGHDTVEELEWTDGIVVNDWVLSVDGKIKLYDINVGDLYSCDETLLRTADAEIATNCARCGEKHVVANKKVTKIEVVKIEKENATSCEPGHITLKAYYTVNGGEEQTSEKTFIYYSDMETYRGRVDHAWDANVTTITPATCTEAGEKVVTRTCKLCGTEEVVSREEIPATGHVAGETEERDGEIITYCEVCGEEMFRVPAAPAEPIADPVADFVARMYDVVLNRQGDEDGAAYWTQRLKDGTQTGAQLAADFFNSAEYLGRNKSDSEYLNDLYNAIMGRNADAAGKAYWQSRINMGYSRNFVLEAFLGSPEFKNICAEYGIRVGSYKSNEPGDIQLKNVAAFVTRLYETCMDRTPDSTGLDYWVKRLVSGEVTGTQAVVYFCNSAEFTGKNLSDSEFVTVLYTAVMGRNAESDGVNYWAGQLAEGVTRTSVVESFAKSPEFGRICESYGITR